MENEEQQQPALDHARTLAQHAGGVVVLAWLVPVAASEEQFFIRVQVEPGSSGARRKEEGEAFLAQAVRAFHDVGVEAVPKIVVTPLPPEQAIIELASAASVPVTVSTLFESGVGLAGALHLATTAPGPQAHGLATAGLLESDLLQAPLSIADGRMAVPPGTGLGVELDPGALSRYRVT